MFLINLNFELNYGFVVIQFKNNHLFLLKINLFMKHTQKILKLLVLAMIFSLFSCSEDLYEVESNSNSGLTFKILTKEEIYKNQKLISKINEMESKNSQIQGKIVTDTIFNFTINTNSATYINNLDVETYTFEVLRAISDGKLENLILRGRPNGEYDSFLVKYGFTAEQKDQGSFNPNQYSKPVYTLIDFDYMTLLTSKCEYSSTIECDEIWTVTCSQGPPREGNNDGGSIGYVTYCNWIMSTGNCTVIWNESCGGGGGDFGGATTSPHGGGGSGLDLPQTPCEKVKNSFTKLPTLQSELSTLSGQTSELNERGRFKVTTATVIQTPSVNASGEVEFNPFTNNTLYSMMAHTHNSPANTTYSVFSWDDLNNLATLIRKGKVDTENFVSFLATADGTYYAFTIEDPETFAQFFAIKSDFDFDEIIGQKRANAMNKYFDPGKKGNPIIKENNTDNVKDEKAFLDFIQDNNIGASLFESNSTFTTFEKVTHNITTNNIDKQPCN